MNDTMSTLKDTKAYSTHRRLHWIADRES